MGTSRRASSPRSSSPKRRLGSETPRIFTPPLRPLTPETSLGFRAIEFAEQICGIDLFPWQRWLLIHALELAPSLTVSTMNERDRLDPIFRFRKIVVLVARQNGKSTLSQVLSLFFLYILGTDLVLGTAQDLDTAEEVWEGALDIIEETPELAELADKPVKVNGKKTIRLLTGERYKVKAANRRAGRGLSGDLILLDELREHQSWDAWAAITKTTMARPAAMIWALSNAGDASSIVLRYLRKAAHAALGDPDGINAADEPNALLPSGKDIESFVDLAGDKFADLGAEDFAEDAGTLGLFEWSAPAGCSVRDRDGWAMANPSMGYGISERTLAGDAVNDPEWVFRTECLCQWSDGTLEGAFPSGTWEHCATLAGSLAPAESYAVGLDVSHDRSRAYVAVAETNDAGVHQAEVVASRAGVEWVVPWLQERAARVRVVALQGNGAPVSDLAESIEEAGLTVLPWEGAELPAGCGRFYDAVRDGKFAHLPQPLLDVAAAIAVTKPLGDRFAWDRRKSPGDIAPLIAVNAAHWALTSAPVTESAYESSGLLIA